MAKKNLFVIWLVGLASIIGSIAVGMALVNGILAVPIIGSLLNQISGWIIVVGGVIAGLQSLGFMK